MSAEEMSLLLAIIGGCVLGVIVALLLVRGNGPSTSEDDDEQARAVSKPAPLSPTWEQEQLRKDGLL